MDKEKDRRNNSKYNKKNNNYNQEKDELEKKRLIYEKNLNEKKLRIQSEFEKYLFLGE